MELVYHACLSSRRLGVQISYESPNRSAIGIAGRLISDTDGVRPSDERPFLSFRSRIWHRHYLQTVGFVGSNPIGTTIFYYLFFTVTLILCYIIVMSGWWNGIHGSFRNYILRVRPPYPIPNMRPLSVGSAYSLQNCIMQVRVLSDAPNKN